MRTVYAQAVRLQQRLDVALLEVQAEEMAEKQDRKQKRAALPKNDPELDAELEAAWEAEQKARRARPVFTPTQQALRNLRALKDPDNNQVNILTRLSMEGGIAIYSDKVRKLRKQQGKPPAANWTGWRSPTSRHSGRASCSVAVPRRTWTR